MERRKGAQSQAGGRRGRMLTGALCELGEMSFSHPPENAPLPTPCMGTRAGSNTPLEDDCLSRPQGLWVYLGKQELFLNIYFNVSVLHLKMIGSWKTWRFSKQLSSTVRWCLLVETSCFFSSKKENNMPVFTLKRAQMLSPGRLRV